MLDFLLNLYWMGDTTVLAMVLLLVLATAAISYFLGCFNGAVIVSKYICGMMFATMAAETRD